MVLYISLQKYFTILNSQIYGKYQHVVVFFF